MKRRFLPIAVLLAFIVAACQDAPVSSDTSAPPASESATSVAPRATDQTPVARDQLLFLDSARHELVIASTRGIEVRHVSDAGIPTSPRSVDPSGHRVAYWRESQDGVELVVWDGVGPSVKVIASELELSPSAAPLWTTDGTALVTTLATAPSLAPPGAFPARGRLELVSASGGPARTLAAYENAGPIIPLSADADIITGFRLGQTDSTYVVLEAKTGAVRSEAVAARFSSFGFAARGRVAWGLVHEFESTKPATLRVWPVDDYAREVARVDLMAPGIPVAWPGRTEIAFSAGSATPGGPYEIRAFDYVSGSSRTAGVVGLGGTPAAFSSDGSALFIYQSTASQYVLARSSNGTLGAAAPYRVAGRRDDPTLRFVGWLLP
jgi:hypothetical protein